MFISNPVISILEVAKAIMRESPSINPKLALLLAQYIYENKQKYIEKGAWIHKDESEGRTRSTHPIPLG